MLFTLGSAVHRATGEICPWSDLPPSPPSQFSLSCFMRAWPGLLPRCAALAIEERSSEDINLLRRRSALTVVKVSLSWSAHVREQRSALSSLPHRLSDTLEVRSVRGSKHGFASINLRAR